MQRGLQRALRAVRGHAVVRAIAREAARRNGLRVYLVGGFLRDALLRRRQALDIDLASADPPALSTALTRRFAGTEVRLAARLWRVLFSHHGKRVQVDITPLRGKTIREDLRRRDFTVNALAISLADDPPRLIDPVGGLRDLRTRRIRVPTVAVLAEDPLRLLRGVRLAAHLNFRIDKHTAEAIRDRASLLARVAPERLREELFAILNLSTGGRWLLALHALSLLETMFPEMRAMRGCLQSPPHRFDVLTHSLETVRALDRLLGRLPTLLPGEAAWLRTRLRAEVEGGVTRQAVLRFAALLHDVGKPDVRSVEGGRVRFLGHAERGAALVEQIGHRLRLGSRASGMAVTLVREHLRPLSLQQEPRLTPRARYRFWRHLGPLAADSLLLSLADLRATWAGDAKAVRAHRRFVQEMFAFFRTRLRAADSETGQKRVLDGHEVMAALGLAPGPFIGFLLARLDEEASVGALRSKTQALRYLRQHLPALRAEFAPGSSLDLWWEG